MSQKPSTFSRILSLTVKMTVLSDELSGIHFAELEFLKCDTESETLILSQAINMLEISRLSSSFSKSDGYNQTNSSAGKTKNVNSAVLKYIYCSISPVV